MILFQSVPLSHPLFFICLYRSSGENPPRKRGFSILAKPHKILAEKGKKAQKSQEVLAKRQNEGNPKQQERDDNWVVGGLTLIVARPKGGRRDKGGADLRWPDSRE